MRALIARLWVASVLVTGTAAAQYAPFNEVGVTMGHWHIASRDVEANKNLFVAMGGTPNTTGNPSVQSPAIVSTCAWGAGQDQAPPSDRW